MNIQNQITKTEEFTAAYEFISTIGKEKKIRFSKSKNKYEICAENFDQSNIGYCLNFVFSKKTVQWVGESTSRTWNGETGEKTVSHISNIKFIAEAAEKELDGEIKEIVSNFERLKYKNPIGAIREIDEKISKISRRIKKITEIQKLAQIGEKNLIETYKNRKEADELTNEFQKIESLVNAISSKNEYIENLKNKLIEGLIKQEIDRIRKNVQVYFENPQKGEKEKILTEIIDLKKVVPQFIKNENTTSYTEKLNQILQKLLETPICENKATVKKEIEKCLLENTHGNDLDIRSESIFNQTKNCQTIDSPIQKKKKNIQLLSDFISKNAKSIKITIENTEAKLTFTQDPKTRSIIDLTSSDLESTLIYIDKVRDAILHNKYSLFPINSKSITQKGNLLFFDFELPGLNFFLNVENQFPVKTLQKKAMHHQNIKIITKKIENIKSDFQIDYEKSNFKENSLLLRSKTIQDLCFSITLDRYSFQMEPCLKKIESLELTEEQKSAIIKSQKEEKKFEFKNTTIEISNNLLLDGIVNGKFYVSNQQFFVTKNAEILVVENDKLGQGGWNRVYKVYSLQNKKHFALMKTAPANKSIDPEKKYQSCVEEMQQGCATLKKLNKNGPVDGIPLCSKEVRLFFGKKMYQKGFMLMELADCDLQQIWQEESFLKLDLKTQLKLFKSLFVGLCTAHEKRIGHGDLKPTNILVQKNESGEPIRLLIGDWSGADKRAKNGKYFIHTPSYTPLEIIVDNPSLEGLKRADLFSLCLTVLEALNGGNRLELTRELFSPQWYPRFFDKHLPEAQKKIKEGLQHIDERIVNVLLEGLCSDAPDIRTFLKNYEKALEEIERG